MPQNKLILIFKLINIRKVYETIKKPDHPEISQAAK